MTGLKIFLGVVLALFLLGRIRLGGEAEYSAAGLLVKARAGWLWFRVFPFKKERKEKPPKPEKERSEKEPKPKSGGPLELVKRYLPLACEAAGELKRKIRIDKLRLDLTVATGNAANPAIAYGSANMALGVIWPVIEQNFEVKDPQIHTGVDFTAQSPVVYIDAAFSARLGQLVSFALRFGWKFFRTYQKSKPHGNDKTQKEAI